MTITTPKVLVNCPRQCKEALAGAVDPIALDIETTGTEKHDVLVSVGILVAGIIHIMFHRSRHATVRNLPIERIRDALSPLADRVDLIVVGHGIGFDLGHLRRVDIPIRCRIRDTEKLLRLVDQDRGRDGGDVKTARVDRRHPGGPKWMNCKLKDVVPQLLGLPMIDFPGAMDLLDRTRHVQYLSRDLAGTRALHDYLWGGLDPGQLRYHDALIGPLTPILDEMTGAGIAADTEFIIAEVARLEALKSRISRRHLRTNGSAITMKARWLNGWLFRTLGLKPKSYKRGKDRKYHPALDREHLTLLHDATDVDRIKRSLRMIRSYRRADSLIIRLRPLLGEVEADGRIRATLVVRQATGRVTASRPNLQAMPKAVTFAGETFRPRNALAASPGHTLVSFDVKQADIRALAHSVESFPRSASKHLENLRAERLLALGNHLDPYLKKLDGRLNPNFRSTPGTPLPQFYPFLPCRLADDFRTATVEFYEAVAAGILGRKPTPEERDAFKTIALGTINGQGVTSLAKGLRCDEASAKAYLTAFESAYPTEMAYKRMIYDQIALTGSVESWAGRTRINTAHRWMVTKPEVDIMISYRRSDAYWLRVVPLEVRRHVLVCWIKAAWDARPGPRRDVKIFSDNRRPARRPPIRPLRPGQASVPAPRPGHPLEERPAGQDLERGGDLSGLRRDGQIAV